MSDSRQGPSRVDGAVPGPDGLPENPGAGNTVQNRNLVQDGVAAAVLGPFTARDIAVFAGVLITFVGSLLPLVQRGSTLNLWNAQNLYFIGIGILLPLVLAALFVWRRLSPETAFRVGSLSLDQFASVVAAFACSYFFVFTVTALTPGGIVGFIGGAVLVVATILGRVIPAFAVDFAGRTEVPAHVVARDAVAPIQKSKTSKPGAQKPGAQKPGAQKPSEQAKTPQGAGSRFPAAARAQGTPSGAAAPWAGSLAADGASSPEQGGARDAGVSSAGAAAAATGAAGAAAAGASVAALAAGAMAAHGEAARDTAAGEGEPRRGGSDRAEAPTGGPGTAPSPEAGTAPSPEAGTARSPEAELDHLIGRHDSRTPTAAEAPVGQQADDAVVLGDADGEAYGAPAGKRIKPTIVPPAGQTAAMPSASEPAPSEPVPNEPAPTQASPILRPVEPEPAPQPESQPEPEPQPEPGRESWTEPDAGAGPPTQLAPAVDRSAGFEATRSYEEPEPEYEAFWFAVNQTRAALDPESGLPLFTLEPGQWILALQDRGDEFVVQSQDGRIGVLRDLSGIERG